jgi:hypothetical protein
MGPSLWTFKGFESKKDLAVGAPDAYWQKTANGWPDEVTIRAWGAIMVKEKIKRGLVKMLIVCDNASIHMDLELAALFRQNDIVLVGMIPSATSKQQPLDKKFFGPIKAKLPTLAARLGVVREYSTVAYLFYTAVKEMEEAASRKGRSVLQSGFAETGLYPFSPDVFTDADFAPSDARLGIQAGDKAIDDAKARGEVYASQVVAQVLSDSQPAAVKKLAERAAAEKAARDALVEKGPRPADASEFAQRSVFTSSSFQDFMAAKQEAKVVDEAARKATAAARAAKAEANKADHKKRKELYEAKKMAWAVAREAKNAAKLARAQAKVAAKAAPAKIPKRKGAPVDPPRPAKRARAK